MNHVFILGAGRSGTKIFRDCIGAAKDVSCIPYDVGYVWRTGNEAIKHDELLPMHLTQGKSDAIKASIRQLSKRAAKSRDFTVVIEKSVPNTLRPLFLKTIFPDAKLIHLVRDGRQVVESSVRNWKSPSDTGYFLDKLRYFPLRNIPYALWYAKNRLMSGKSTNARVWGPRYNGMQEDANSMDLIEVCAKQWLKCVDTCDEQLAQLPQSDVHTIRYEDFTESVSTVFEVCEFAGINDIESVSTFYEQKIRRNGTFTPSEEFSSQELEFINALAKTTLARHGYI